MSPSWSSLHVGQTTFGNNGLPNFEKQLIKNENVFFTIKKELECFAKVVFSHEECLQSGPMTNVSKSVLGLMSSNRSQG